VTALLAVIEPNNWVGALVVLGTCLGAVGMIGLLFGWDGQGTTQANQDRDILKGPLR
jgi:hypothetical protein